MGITAAVGIAAVVAGTVVSANAQQSAANAQHDEAQTQLQFQEQTRDQANAIAQPTFQEMQGIQTQIQMSSDLLDTQISQIKQQQTLYENVTDQATKLLNGQDAASLTPLNQSIAAQRTQLQNQLRDQLGTGYAATSAGQEALARFDQQANASTVSAQQSSIAQYMGYSSQLGSQVTNEYNSAYGMSNNILQNAQSNQMQLQANQIAAINATPVNFNNAIATAGYQSVGAGVIGGGISQVGGILAGAGAKGAASAPSSSSGSLMSGSSTAYAGPDVAETAGSSGLMFA